MLENMDFIETTVNYGELGKRIRTRRKSLNLTQEHLSEEADVSTAFIGAIERASSKLSVETLMKLCKVLNVTPNYLLLGVDNEYHKDELSTIKDAIYRCSESKRALLLEFIRVFADFK